MLDHLGVSRAAVVGTSQGGFVAPRMALLAPSRVSAIAVLGTSAQLTLTMGALVDRDEVLSRAGEITCPALVLHGSADLAYPVERAAELADALPAAEPLVVVDGGAHFLSYTHAEAVNPALKRFLDAHA